jgi:hypothetical protein
MRRAAFTLLVCFLCCLTAYPQTPSTITEQQVIDILNSMDRAARRKNIAGMIAPLADDVKIRVTLTTSRSDQSKVLSFTKEEYAYQAKMAFKVLYRTETFLNLRFKYALERKNVRVKFYDEGKTALVTSELYERFSAPKVVVHAVSSESSYLILRDGKLLFTSIETSTRVDF